ncbi:MAG TPA: DUF1761 domain-containing protein [Opitutaceae bacterium]|nr:DUF1761 domain-containing protein [Opitutaceae bacterium]
MMSAFHSLNYLTVTVAALAGFLLGAVWYMVLFGKSWAAEMGLAMPQPGEPRPPMAGRMIRGLILTFVSAVGLGVVLAISGHVSWKHGAARGAVIGLLVVGARYANSAIWEKKSAKLQAINIGHEVALFALQGAILAHGL